MKIIFITNYACFHQIGIWDSFYQSLNSNDSFIFLSTSHVDKARLKMNYREEDRDYIKRTNEMSEDDLKLSFQDVDVVIVGSVEDDRVWKYIWKRKYYISATEHIYKKGIKNFLGLEKHMLTLFFHGGYRNKYLIAYSSRVGKEFSLNGFYKKHIFKFGYFPHLECVSENSISNKDQFQLCFCGRLLDWKRPVLALKILEKFIKFDNRYHLVIIGEGSERTKINNYIKKHNLANHCKIMNFQKHDEVLKIMRESSFYLFTSAKQEGWGVVLNEAMSQGCIPIASSKAGSTNFLVKDNVNGFIFKSKRDLRKIVKNCVLMSLDLKKQISIQSANTIESVWNCENAGKRLHKLIVSICNKDELPHYEEGPVSKK